MNNNNQFLQLRTALTDWLAKNKQTAPTGPKDIRIGIWGTSRSGKTTYLAMLYSALEDSEEWIVQAGDDHADDFIDTHISDIDAGNFPPATQPTANLNIFTYILKTQFSQGTGSIVLNFIDAPGEFYEDIRGNAAKEVQIHEAQNNQDTSGDIVDYLRSCDGIIFLLDPIRSKKQGESYKTLLLRLFREFQKRSRKNDKDIGTKLEQYMAFCVTKVDKEEIWSQGKKSAVLTKDVMGEQLFKKLRTNFCIEGRYEFFSVASIGRYKDKDGKSREAVIYPDIPETQPPQRPQPPQPPQPPQGSYVKGYGYEEGYDPDAPSGEPNTPPSSSSSSDDDWESLNQTSNTPELPSTPLPTINTEVEYEPFNVIAPIKWLIDSIQKQPPSRQQSKEKS